MLKLNTKSKKLIPLAIGGLLLAGFQLYSASGEFGLFEIVTIAITAVTILGVILLINKIFTKND